MWFFSIIITFHLVLTVSCLMLSYRLKQSGNMLLCCGLLRLFRRRILFVALIEYLSLFLLMRPICELSAVCSWLFLYSSKVVVRNYYRYTNTHTEEYWNWFSFQDKCDVLIEERGLTFFFSLNVLHRQQFLFVTAWEVMLPQIKLHISKRGSEKTVL